MNDIRQKTLHLLLWLTFFSIAMGFLETAVVVYLRELYYPQGFDFPLHTIAPRIAVTEFFREIATLVMLLAAGVLTGRNATERFAGFIFSFAVWDIFYYLFLKLLLNWPPSLLTWDILFLVPVTWVGPVIAPCLISLTMILLAVAITYFYEKNQRVKIARREWFWLIIGSLLTVLTFVWDYCRFVLQHFSFSEIWTVPNKKLFDLSLSYVPQSFNWFLFTVSEMVLLLAIFMFFKRNYSELKYSLSNK